jgi:hypothetical protein
VPKKVRSSWLGAKAALAASALRWACCRSTATSSRPLFSVWMLKGMVGPSVETRSAGASMVPVTVRLLAGPVAASFLTGSCAVRPVRSLIT